MSIWDFAQQEEGRAPDWDMIARIIGLSTALLRSGTRQIFGAGLVVRDGVLHPVMLAQFAKIVPDDFRPQIEQFGSAGDLYDIVANALGARPEWMNAFYVYRCAPPIMLQQPGDPITNPLPGTIGCGVKWAKKFGFMTAGHVAAPVNTTVADQNGPLGVVVYSNDPAGHGSAIEDDVAVVELPQGHAPVPAYAGPGNGQPGEWVDVELRANKRSAQLMGYNYYLYLPPYNGTCGDVYFTSQQVTVPGDSGAPVTKRNGTAIGHVLGASPGFATYIQDVNYQLGRIGAQAPFAGIKLA
ncbi:MAG TPA: hypothetical protein VGH49_06505 [Xanthobacteraceae bacterium]|jgi:hypothetical protein